MQAHGREPVPRPATALDPAVGRSLRAIGSLVPAGSAGWGGSAGGGVPYPVSPMPVSGAPMVPKWGVDAAPSSGAPVPATGTLALALVPVSGVLVVPERGAGAVPSSGALPATGTLASAC